MKTIKKILAMFVALMMAFTMNAPVFAAASTGKITLHTGSIDVSNTTFKIYKIMDAEKVDDTHADYTIESNFIDFFNSLVPSISTDEGAYDYLNTNIKNTAVQQSIKTYIKDKNISASETIAGGLVNSYTTVNSLDYGYYVIIPDNASFSMNFTTVNSSNVDVYLKAEEPGVDKKADNQDWTSAQVGDTINFTVTSKVPNMTGYDSYVYQFTDTMTEGLTVSADTLNMGITIGTKTLTKDTDYTVTVEGQKISVNFNKFIQYKNQANEEMKFTYQATLNEKAVKETTKNKVEVKYGHDDSSLSEGKTDETIIKTHDLKITKVDSRNENTKLAGAKFKLYKGTETTGSAIKFTYDSSTDTYTVTTDENGTTDLVTTDTGIINVKGLDDGDYRLVEIDAPTGYAKLKNPVEIKIIATSSDNGTTVTVTGNAVTVKNSTESWLPETGGMGTVIFTVVGAAGLFTVLSSYLFDSKKKKAK